MFPSSCWAVLYFRHHLPLNSDKGLGFWEKRLIKESRERGNTDIGVALMDGKLDRKESRNFCCRNIHPGGIKIHAADNNR
jgi:hypothetical protein